MNQRTATPTCVMGFWKPEVSGCPVCGPDGPCTVDPEGLAEMQALERRAWRQAWIDWGTVAFFVAVIASAVWGLS